MQRQQEKQREIELKAQQKYKDWLQKKNQERIEKEKKEKVMLIFKMCCLLFFTSVQIKGG